MSGKLFQARKKERIITNSRGELDEIFEINFLDAFHSTITCIRVHSLILYQTSYQDKNLPENGFEENKDLRTIKNFLLEKLNFVLENNFKRVSYTEAIDILRDSTPNKKKKFQYINSKPQSYL